MAQDIRISPEAAKKLIGDEATAKLTDYMQTHAEILQTMVTDFVDLLWPVVTALAAVGILSMALIEAWKSVRQPRRKYQKDKFEEWFRERAEKSGKDAGRALEDLVMLATAGNADALYELPVQRFTGQLNAALQVALAYPDEYPDVVAIMACGARPDDITILLGLPPDPDNKSAVQKYSAARTRVASVTQRSLDAIQIDIGNRWARRLHYYSVALSSILIGTAAVWSHLRQESLPRPRDVVVWIVIAVVGGMVAPVARDLVTALKRVRDRPR